MPDFDHLAREVDRLALTVEQGTLDTIAGWLRPIERRLEDEVRRFARRNRDDPRQSTAFRQARARAAVTQVTAILERLDIPGDGDVSAAFHEMQRRAYDAGIRSAEGTLTAYNDELPARFAMEVMGPRPDVEKLRSLAEESVTRLRRHAAGTIEAVQEELASHLTDGKAVDKTARAVRRRTGLLAYESERIVRTEVMSTTDDARKRSFREGGVEYEQRIATNDARVCAFCLARDGNVYRLGEAPAVLHPNDRCVTAPWNERWPDAVRGDEEHRRRKREAAAASGIEPDPGPTYWEKRDGVDPPSPIFTP